MDHAWTVLNVELVEAESKRPFKKHKGPDDNTYVEVEPEAEYFIKVIISMPEKKTICDAKVTLRVDGESLGYKLNLSNFTKVAKNGTAKYMYYAGYYFRKNGVESLTSLKFGAPSTRNLSDEQPKTGKVAVSLLVRNKPVPKNRQKLQSNKPVSKNRQNQQSSPSDFETKLNGKPIFSSEKAVQTVRGAIEAGDITEKDFDVDEREDNETTNTFSNASTGASALNRSSDGHQDSYSVKCGDDGTAEIELNYCSVLGLIHHGVIPKPPLWDWGRMVHPNRDRNGTPEHVDAPEPKIMKLNAVVEGGVVIREEMSFDYFDLT